MAVSENVSERIRLSLGLELSISLRVYSWS